MQLKIHLKKDALDCNLMLDKSNTIVKCTMVKLQYLRLTFLLTKWYKIRRILV